MPEHPPAPPTGRSTDETIDYIKDVIDGDYTDEVKIKAIKKAVK